MKGQFCGKCGNKLYSDSNFCQNCGNQVSEPFFCPNCEKELHPDTELCPSCGTEISEQMKKNHQEDITSSQNDTQVPVDQKSTINNNIDTLNEFPLVNEKKEKILKAQSTIKVAKKLILIIGIFVLVQNILLVSLITSLSGAQFGATTIQSQNKINRINRYDGFQERNYRSNQPNTVKKPKIKGNVFKLLILVVILGIIQGGGFIFLSSYINKKPFISILIAFIFEITYDILKVVTMIYRTITGFNIGYGGISKLLSNPGVSALMIMQVVQLILISTVIVFYLGKSLKSAIDLRKLKES